MFLEWRNEMIEFRHKTDKGYIVHIAAWHFDGVSLATRKGKNKFYSHKEFNELFEKLIDDPVVI